jgi:hypothetical protein
MIMRTAICDAYGIDAPIFGFSHSPRVVAAVTQAGGFGVLGASGMEPEELDRALQMISQTCQGKSFGVDMIIPENYVGSEVGGLDIETLQQYIPQGHRDFVAGLMDKYHIPEWTNPQGSTVSSRAGMGISLKRGEELVEIALFYRETGTTIKIRLDRRVGRSRQSQATTHASANLA